MNMKIISIIVAIYNVRDYLEECIESIIRQSMSDIEIILVDDGSTDASGNICDQYAVIDERIRVIHKNNGGLVSARKEGLKASNGKYVMLLDGDDTLDIYACQRMYELIEKNDVDFVHTNYREINGKTVDFVKFMEIIDLCFLDRYEFIIQRVFKNNSDLYQHITSSIWSKIFKNEFIKEVYSKVPDGQSFGEDLICLCNALLQCKRILLAPKVYYNYRIRKGSLSRSTDWNGIGRAVELKRIVQNIMGEKYAHNIEEYFCKIFLSQLNSIHHPAIQIQRCIYKDYLSLINKNIVIYGAGEVGRNYYNQLIKYRSINIVALVDKRYEHINLEYVKVLGLERLYVNDYDYVLIAVDDSELVTEIIKELECMGVNGEKIIWNKPQWFW